MFGHWSRLKLGPPVAAVILALLVTGCTSVEGTGNVDYVSGDGQIREIAVPDRGEPVELSGKDLDGKPLSLGDFRGKPVVVAVWGSWCGPCNKEAPELVKAAKELGDSAQFVGINIRDASPTNAQSFVRKYDIPYPSFYSSGGVELLAFNRTIGPRSVPAFVVLDAEGRIAASVIGEVGSKSTLLGLVETVLTESTDG